MSVTPLAAFQATFFAELLAEPDAPGAAAFARQPGFAVYRNTVMAGCIEALAANYPIVRALVGDARFGDLARAYVRAAPPRDGVLAGYGDGFAAWLASRAEQGVPVLAGGLARLDRAWTESHLAADAPLLEPGTLGALAAERFAVARLTPHPAARWVELEDPELYAWWRARRAGEPMDDAAAIERKGEGVDVGGGRGDDRSQPRSVERSRCSQADGASGVCGGNALLTRPDGAVVWTAIGREAVVFLEACASGRVVADALEAAAAGGPASAVARWLPALMHARAFTRLDDGCGANGA
jgi:hypothetical protein